MTERSRGVAGPPFGVVATRIGRTDLGTGQVAFDARRLREALESSLRAFAAERHVERGPARRALEAELIDVAEPLMLAMQGVGDAASGARESPDDIRLWRLWAGQLRLVFEVAD